MNYEKFVKEVKRGVEDIVEKELGEGVVVVRNVLKNNNVRRKAISIVRKEEVATPTIYLRNYFVDFKHGRDMTNICTEIFNMYLYSMDSFNADIDLRDIADFEKVKTMIHYKLINYEMNKELLKKVPHLKFLDLAIVFYIMVSEDGEGQATALIHKEHLEGFRFHWPHCLACLIFSKMMESAGEKDEISHYKINKPLPETLTIEDIISDMILKDILGDEDWVEDEFGSNYGNGYGDEFGESFEGDDGEIISEDTMYGDYTYGELKTLVREEVNNMKIEDINMYVMSNTMKLNGATCITYPHAIENFANEHDSDVYIIPSSIHEVILIPDISCSREYIDEMIRDVNRRQLDPVDVLSDHVYMYRRDIGEIE